MLEIGPGRGALTRRLVEGAGRVIAVELDSLLCEQLPARLGFPPNLRCVTADAREADLSSLAGFTGTGAVPYKVLGNLPYYAANPIVRRTLESDAPPSMAIFMVQREVADIMTAQPGSMGLLSVATQFYSEARMVCSVPPSAFRPRPKVRSAVIRLDVREKPAVDVADREEFFELVRAGFASPRKQLHNSLSHGLAVDGAFGRELLQVAGIDGSRRPAALNLDEWASVCRVWNVMKREMAGLAG